MKLFKVKIIALPQEFYKLYKDREQPRNRGWRRERVTVEKVFDELRIGAKDLSSRVIAGSLRNAFRGSLGQYFTWV